jgi:tRNA A37 threonylcarbamoyladenosine synthetase subunit TsaC/SUA5/YrdC
VTVLPLDDHGIASVAAALRDDEAVVIPFPSPLPYAVAATDPATVNEAKGRPADQPCGLLVGAAEEIAPHLDLDPETLALALSISRVEQANLFVPIRPGAPRWLSAGAVDGLAGITLAWPARTRPLADEFGHLFVSSANLTSRPVAVTAGQADAAFGEKLVLDGEPFRDPGVAQGSATIIEVRRHGRLRVVRDGINNRSFPGDRAEYLEALRERFSA